MKKNLLVRFSSISGNSILKYGAILTSFLMLLVLVSSFTNPVISNKPFADNTLDKLGLTNSTPAAGAYSLRLLSSDYNGALVRIAIGSNFYDVYPDATADHAFSLTSSVSAAYSTYNAASTGSTATSLGDVISSNSATVAIWYDQSGNGRNGMQATLSLQPQIINAGAINTTNSKVSVKFAGAQYLVVTTSAFNDNLSGTIVYNATSANTSAGGAGTWYNMNGIVGSEQGGDVADFAYGVYNGRFTAGFGGSDNSVGSNTTVNDGTTRVSSWTRSSLTGGVALFNSGSGDGGATLALNNRSAVPSVAIGAATTSGLTFFNGTISEITLFPIVYIGPEKQAIETNQSAYYGVTVLQALISTSGTLSALTTTRGTASASISFDVSGTALSAGILVTPPAGFEVSLNNSSFSSTVTVGTGGTSGATPVYIRLSATANYGTYSGNITLTSSGANPVNITTAASIINPQSTDYPAISYGAAKVIGTGEAITPISPTSTNVDAFGYSNYTTLANDIIQAKAVAKDSQGNTYIVDVGSLKLFKYPVGGGPRVEVVTGGYPYSMSIDGADNIYFIDAQGYSLKKIAAGTGTVTTLATGFTDGYNIAAAKDGTVYVVDNSDNAVKKVPVGGGTPVLVGTGFSSPIDVAVGADGDVYVADSGSGNIKKIWITTDGHTEDIGNAGQPFAVAVDNANNVYAADAQNQRIYEIPANGDAKRILASGTDYQSVYKMFIEDNGVVNIATPIRPGITVITPKGGYFINSILPNGLSFNQTTGIISGTPTTPTVAKDYVIAAYNGAGPVTATLNIAVASGNADLSSLAVTGAAISPAFDAATITYTSSVSSSVASVDVTPTAADADATITYNGNAVTSGSVVMVPLAGGDNSIAFVVTSPAGNTKTYTITINKSIPPTVSYGTAQVFAINTAITPVTPTAANVAAFGYSSPVDFGGGLIQTKAFLKDSQGNYYLLDAGLLKLYKYLAGGGPAVEVQTRADDIGYPNTIALDDADNLYAFDVNGHYLRKIEAGTGVITNLTNDLSNVYGITVAKDGTVYVADLSTNQVKKIPAGGGTPVAVGTGFNAPTDVALDLDGNLYVADQGNGKLKKIWITTDGHTEDVTDIRQPVAVTVDKANNVFVSDLSNFRIYELPANGSGPQIIAAGNNFQDIYGLQVDDKGIINMARTSSTTGKIINPSGGYFINARLPAGLSFDQNTGIISGTPTQLSPATQYKITAYNDIESVTSTITIGVASNNANLSALAVTGVTITPAFDAGTIAYSASVGSTVASVDITPTAADADATITYNGNAVTSGSVVMVPLAGGDNSIAFVVTSPAGNTKTYTITINKSIPPTVSYGTAQVFAINTAITPVTPTAANVAAFGYSSPVDFGGGLIQTKAFLKDSQGNYYLLDAGLLKLYKYLAGGGPAVEVQTRADDIGYPNTIALDDADNLYAFDVNGHYLRKIEAGTGVITNLTNDLSNVYGITVAKDGTVYVADLSTNQVKKIPAGGGTPVAVGTGFNAPTDVALDLDGNLYVADQGNGKLKKIWITTDGHTEDVTDIRQPVAVTVDKANNVFVSDLSNFRIYELPANGSGPQIIAAGNNFQDIYGLQVDDKGIINMARTSSTTGKIINPSGGYFINARLPAGLSFDQNTGIISGTPTQLSPATQYRITAYNGLDSTNARITLGVEANRNLTNLVTDAGALTPMFDADSLNYKITVNGGVTSANITATLSELSNSLTINGVTATSGATASIALNTGDNNVPVVVTSPLDNSTKTYTVNIHRISNDYKLANLTSSVGTLSPAFDADVNDYTIDLPYGTSSARLTPTVNAFATVKVDEVVTASGTESQTLNLHAGDNNINVHVTAEDGTSATIYVVNLRVAGPSSVSLSDITLSAGTLNPAFNAGNANYRVSVPVGTPTITVHPMLSDALSVATVNGWALDGTTGSVNVPLNDGLNVIAVSVLANDGTTTNSYTITVNKLVPAPTNTPIAAQVYHSGTAITPLGTGFGNVAAPGYFALADTISRAISTPTGIAINKAGDLFVADVATGSVYKIPVGGGAPSTILTGLNTPLGVATDADGNVYAVGLTSTSVEKVTPDGTIATQGSGLSFPTALTVDTAGNVFVVQTTNHTVKKVTPAGVTTIVTTALAYPYGITTHADHIYVTDNDQGTIVRFNKSGGARIDLISGLINPTDVKVDAAGNIYVNEGGDNKLTKFDKDGLNPVVISAGYTGLFGMALGTDGKIYTTDNGRSTVDKLTPSGGYYLSDALPAGLVFDTVTGIISSTPTTVSAAKDYTITAYNSGGGTASVVNISVVANANLVSIGLRTGTLSPVFNAETEAYVVSVPFDINEITITPTAQDEGATLLVNNVAVATGTPSGPIALNPGANTIDIVVTAQDGVTTKTYQLVITRLASDNTGLLSIETNPGSSLKLQNNSSGLAEYTGTVSLNTSVIRIKPTAKSAVSTLMINGLPALSGVYSDPIALNAGANTIDIVVTAQDGVTTKTYRLVITRLASDNTGLLSIETNPGSSLKLKNNNSGLAEYTGTVTLDISSIRIKPTAKSAVSTLMINGLPALSGVYSDPIALNAGANTIDIVVTAQDGVTTKTYRLVITRLASDNTGLLSIETNPGSSLKLKNNNSGLAEYTGTVTLDISSIRIKPTAKSAVSTLMINGLPALSGVYSDPIALNAGANTIDIVVTAQDGVTTKTYRLVITRLASDNTGLLSIETNPGSSLKLKNNNSGLAEYTGTVTLDISVISIKPTAKSAVSTLMINGLPALSGVYSDPIALNAGANTIDIVVTAQDGVTTKTYRLVITRLASDNTGLLSIETNPGSSLKLKNNNSGLAEYTGTVTLDISSIRIKPTAKSAVSTLMINGLPALSGVYSDPIALNAGANTIDIVVTAQDGVTTKTYRLVITKPTPTFMVDKNDSKLLFANKAANPVAPSDNDGVVVHQGVSPNGDGSNDFLSIEGISQYAGNKLSIMNGNGALVFEAKDYGKDGNNLFDGHSNKNGALLKPGTYFYALEYQVDKNAKRKTGYIIIKY